jgi:hypothetical protein
MVGNEKQSESKTLPPQRREADTSVNDSVLYGTITVLTVSVKKKLE